MEAGAGFRESLEAVVRENAGHPVGQEFGQVMRELEHGQTLLQSLVLRRDLYSATSILSTNIAQRVANFFAFLILSLSLCEFLCVDFSLSS